VRLWNIVCKCGLIYDSFIAQSILTMPIELTFENKKLSFFLGVSVAVDGGVYIWVDSCLTERTDHSENT